MISCQKMDVQILDARSYFDVILYTTKSVLDKNRFMDRPNRDESGQNPTQGLFLTNLIRSTQAIFQVTEGLCHSATNKH